MTAPRIARSWSFRLCSIAIQGLSGLHQRQAPSAQRRAPNAQRPAPNAQRQAPSAKRQTPKRRAILRCGLRCSQCREMHDFFFRCVVPGKLARQSAVPHNEDPIC
jgi:hypothetical protein